MNCSEFQELMLEADPELLMGIGDEPLAAHIRACEVCRDLASAMMGQVQVARLAYARIEPVSVPARHAVRSIARRAMWAVGSLVAAAAVVFAVTANRGGVTARDATAASAKPDSASTPIAVEVPEGKNAIVFNTRNPRVSVVWIY